MNREFNKINPTIFKEYVAACKEIKSYYRVNIIEPKEIRERYKLALNAYTDHLDKLGLKMPNPIYDYKKDDESTWRYLDVVITTDKHGKRRCAKTIINPAFKGR